MGWEGKTTGNILFRHQDFWKKSNAIQYNTIKDVCNRGVAAMRPISYIEGGPHGNARPRQ
jgi:hypothetical protein